MKSKTPPANRFWKYLFGLLESVLALLLVVNLILPDHSFSQMENRPLQMFPSLSWNALVSGRAGSDLESYAADQFVGRNLFFHVSYAVRKALGQREIDEVFLGNGALLQQNTLPAPGFLESQIHTINEFAASIALPCTVLTAPSAASIQTDRLPLLAPVNDINPCLDQLYTGLQTQGADVRTLFREHASEYIFYRTDHHWTTRGAMLASQQLLDTFSIALDPEAFSMMEVSDSFQGTLASKTGSFGIHDEIFIAPDKAQTQYLVTWADGHKTASIYDRQALDQKDQYEVFLGKNQSVIHVETLSESQENLLLFKDSYANSMIQFLIPYYRNIYIVDPRYYYEDIAYLLTMGEITQCAFVFSSNTFMSDRSLQDVLRSFLEDAAASSEENEEGSEEENPEPEDEPEAGENDPSQIPAQLEDQSEQE